MGCVNDAIQKLGNFKSKKDKEKRKLSLIAALEGMKIEEETKENETIRSRYETYDIYYSIDYDMSIDMEMVKYFINFIWDFKNIFNIKF